MPFVVSAQGAFEKALSAEPELEKRTALVANFFRPTAEKLKQGKLSVASYGQPCEIRHAAHGFTLIEALERSGAAVTEWGQYWRFIDRVLLPTLRSDPTYGQFDVMRRGGRPVRYRRNIADDWIEEGAYLRRRHDMRCKMIRAIELHSEKPTRPRRAAFYQAKCSGLAESGRR